MTFEEIEARVRATIAAYYEKPVANLPDDLSSLEADSLEQIEIGMEIEDAFDIDIISDDERALCHTVGDWTDLVAKKVGA